MTRIFVGRECRLSNLWEDWTPSASRIVDPPASGNYRRAVATWTVVLKYHQHPDSSPPAPGDYSISVAIWIVVLKHNHHLDLPGRQHQKIGWKEAIRKIILWLPGSFRLLRPPTTSEGTGFAWRVTSEPSHSLDFLPVPYYRRAVVTWTFVLKHQDQHHPEPPGYSTLERCFLNHAIH